MRTKKLILPNQRELDKLFRGTSPLHSTVWRLYGMQGFTARGTIKLEALQQFAKGEIRTKVHPLAMKRARKALNLFGKWNGKK